MKRSSCSTTRRTLLLATLALLAAAARSSAQGSDSGPRTRPSPTGWELAGLPALNFDADEGLGYGAIVQLYDYGRGVQPYRLTVQPTLFLTTEGRRDVTLFVDAPAVAGRFRITAYAGREQQLAQPYYGIGNASPYDARLEQGANPYFYRFGRTRTQAMVDVQHPVGSLPIRLLGGVGASRADVDLTPFDSGTTLLATERGGVTPPVERERWGRLGVVMDTRDREIGTTRGMFNELLLQFLRRDDAVAPNATRWTATTRFYVPIGDRLVFAQRATAQRVLGDLPVTELSTIQSSTRFFDGVGGASSVRGIPKDRYTGRSLFVENSELRWRAAELSILGKPSALVLSGFLDAGRVWDDALVARELLRDLHAGYGAGARVAWGPSFVVAVDVAHSSEATAPIYIGLGYLF